jgi:hypothetical protein
MNISCAGSECIGQSVRLGALPLPEDGWRHISKAGHRPDVMPVQGSRGNSILEEEAERRLTTGCAYSCDDKVQLP